MFRKIICPRCKGKGKIRGQEYIKDREKKRLPNYKHVADGNCFLCDGTKWATQRKIDNKVIKEKNGVILEYCPNTGKYIGMIENKNKEELLFEPVEPTSIYQPNCTKKDFNLNVGDAALMIKNIANDKDVKMSLFAHPNIIELLDLPLNWKIDNSTKIGDVQLDFRFGTVNIEGTDISIISTSKIKETEGVRIITH